MYIPHGGGPLPLMGDPGHHEMVSFLKNLATTVDEPTAVLVISAHWEESIVSITSAHAPSLLYDYYGFPDEAYEIKYPAKGSPELAGCIYELLQADDIDANLDSERGFDHGMFVPLKIMYPKANIPCVQVSLTNTLDPVTHIRIGRALSKLRKENVLILGSGLSFHNLGAFRQGDAKDVGNEVFEEWLKETCAGGGLSTSERIHRLIQWSDAPFARYCHPREEHLLPLHVCYGAAETVAETVFSGTVINKKASGFLW